MAHYRFIVPGKEIQGLRIRRNFFGKAILQVCYNLIDVTYPGRHASVEGHSDWEDVKANNLVEVTAVNNLLAKLDKDETCQKIVKPPPSTL